MIGANVRSWVVNIAQDDDDALYFGPYTRRKARELADAFNVQIERGVFEGEGWIHAGAMPIRNPQSVTAMLAEFSKTPVRS